MSIPGHIELDRAVDSLHVGRRHRADLGDMYSAIRLVTVG